MSDYYYSQYDVAEGILAKQALAECDQCAFQTASSLPVRDAKELASAMWITQIGAAIFEALTVDIVSSENTQSVGFIGTFTPGCNRASDSQRSPREIRARDARIINQRAREHAAKVFSFEEPFLSEEPTLRLETRDASRVVRLQKRR